MTKRYKVEQRPGFTDGKRVYEVIDTQTNRAAFDSLLKSDCLKRARKLNANEAAYAGGFNGRRK